jgi:predicted HicB family RNase H-like nuclease
MVTAERKSGPTQVRISLELREAVKVRAAQQKMTMQAFVDAAVAAALAQ